MRQADRKLKEGIVALKAARKVAARHLLKESVNLDPSNWKAWLWLSRSVENEEEQVACLEKSLELNPNNELAQQELAVLRPPPKPTDKVPDQPVAILAEILKEQRREVQALKVLQKQSEKLRSSVDTIRTAAIVWMLLLLVGFVLGCIAVLVGDSLLF